MLIFILLALATSKLVAVVEICRHGARAPTTFMPGDNDKIWPQGEGELLPEGMRQHYLIGQELRKRYIKDEEFLSFNYYQPEIYVFTTDINRTIMSAQSQLQGLYPAGTGPVLRNTSIESDIVPPIHIFNQDFITNNLKFSALPHFTQVIPVHSDSNERLSFLKSKEACPYYHALAEYKMSLPDLQKIYDQDPFVTNTIMEVLNLTKKEAQKRIRKISDSLISNSFMKNPLPQGFNQTFFERVQVLATAIKNYNFFEPDYLARVAGGFLISEVLENLKSAKNESTTKKFFLYSAHDTTLAFSLAFLQQNISVLPPFASTLIFELRETNGLYFVTVAYNDNFIQIPKCKGLKCTFEEFEDYVKQREIPKLKELCDGEVTNDFQGSVLIDQSSYSEKLESKDTFNFIFYVLLYSAIYIGLAVVLCVGVKFLMFHQRKVPNLSLSITIPFNY